MVTSSPEVRGKGVGKIRGVSVGGSGVSTEVEVGLGGGSDVLVAVATSVSVAEGESATSISGRGVGSPPGKLHLFRRKKEQHSMRISRFISFTLSQ